MKRKMADTKLSGCHAQYLLVFCRMLFALIFDRVVGDNVILVR